MSRLHLEEVRRFVSHLRTQVADPDRLIEIEGELQGEEARDLLLEPQFLAWFPALEEDVAVTGMKWRLRVIPHARLRMVQRGIDISVVLNLFTRFVEQSVEDGVAIVTGPYTIRERSSGIVLRLDVDVVETESGKAHVVTVFIGRGSAEAKEQSMKGR